MPTQRLELRRCKLHICCYLHEIPFISLLEAHCNGRNSCGVTGESESVARPTGKHENCMDDLHAALCPAGRDGDLTLDPAAGYNEALKLAAKSKQAAVMMTLLADARVAASKPLSRDCLTAVYGLCVQVAAAAEAYAAGSVTVPATCAESSAAPASASGASVLTCVGAERSIGGSTSTLMTPRQLQWGASLVKESCCCNPDRDAINDEQRHGGARAHHAAKARVQPPRRRARHGVGQREGAGGQRRGGRGSSSRQGSRRRGGRRMRSSRRGHRSSGSRSRGSSRRCGEGGRRQAQGQQWWCLSRRGRSRACRGAEAEAARARASKQQIEWSVSA